MATAHDHLRGEGTHIERPLAALTRVLQHPVKLGEEMRLLNYRQFYRLYFRMREYGSIDDVNKDEIRRYVPTGY